MGAGNVKEVFARWSHLDHAPFRLLCYMAVVSKDDDPRYWGGQEALMMALGMSPDADQALRSSTKRVVTKWIRALIDAKAIKLTERPAPGRNAEYTLSLSIEREYAPFPRTDERSVLPSNGGASMERWNAAVPNGGTERDQRWNAAVVTVERPVPPEEEQDIAGLKTGRSGYGPRARTSPARARARARQPKLSSLEGGGEDIEPDRQPGLWPAPVQAMKASGR